ncbi:glycoside hydrolase family 2 protein [Leeuwenhoekiella parthenopeia]|uniref:Beta-galactosidase n=1 Tax=Leeuwenhoekiella parthenopeia TaxID=2890320 RepID=A0ABS8GMX5_9FLAO|nr:sugar-binding domain-containing protein [Leeuwenhoekiella parthenopeia]MCC4211265.1 beta-galactosidase [Leeuwenhoekiella parthenopeia]
MKASILYISIFIFISGFAQQKNVQSTHLKAEKPLVTPWAADLDKYNPLPEYPRPTMVRERWKNLNGQWQFGEAKPGDALPVSLNEEITVPFPWESYLSGIQRQLESKTAWYKRDFNIPRDWDGYEINLNFGAVDFEARVFVNDKFVGGHKGGYDPYSFNITQYLKVGTNSLTIWVNDPTNTKGIAYGKQNEDRFNNPQRFAYSASSGIWQTVWLEPVPAQHIDYLKILPFVDDSEVEVLVNASAKAQSKIFVKVMDGSFVVGEGRGSANIPFRIPVSNPKLWSPNDPFLYDVVVTLQDSTTTYDEVKSYTGMRKISIEKVGNLKKIFLNDKFLFQMGPLDQGYWPDGIYTAPTDEALVWDVKNIKDWGFNMVRKHIKIEPQRWYYHCDREGLLVWQDMPSTFGERTEYEKIQFEAELSSMVQGFASHPSIITWVVFNEHWGLYDVERITNNVIKMDPSRLVIGNSGIDAGKPDIDYEVGHIKDNHSYRPPSVPFASNKRAVVNGEYGAIGYNVDGHVWDLDGPWVHNNYDTKEAATEEYLKFIRMITDDFQKEGLSASVYTQWTDVENEMNGLYTYDRKVEKLDKNRVKEANLTTYLPKKEN